MSTFCPIPWDHISLRSNGDMRVCCQCVYGDQAVLKKEDGSIYNGTNDTVEDSRNATILKEIRKSMLDGEQHDACKLCWDEEKIGVTSKRKHANIMGLIPYHEAVDITEKDGTLIDAKRPISYYDLRLGNKCNLKCRSCGPADSSQWYDDWVKAHDNTKFGNSDIGFTELVKNKQGKWSPINHTFNWYENSKLVDELKNNLSSVKRMYFTGGEPTIIREHMSILELCVKQNVAKNIHLEYNTNMAKMPTKLLSLWEKFQQVSVGCSIDGVEDVAEYLRFPCKWDVIYKNMLALENTKKGNIGGAIATTVSVYNILHFADMITWQLDQNFVKLRSLPSSHLLKGPKYMAINILPPDAKMVVKNKYDNMLDLVGRKNGPTMRNRVEHLVVPYMNFMFEEDRSDLLPEFWEVTKKMDTIRKQSFEHTFPDLYELIKDYV